MKCTGYNFLGFHIQRFQDVHTPTYHGVSEASSILYELSLSLKVDRQLPDEVTNQATGKGLRGNIDLTSALEGFAPITGEGGWREKKKDVLTVIIEKTNEKYGASYTEISKVFLQMENDYTSSVSWKDYAASNDRKTLMLLFEKGIPNMTAARYKKNENFFVKLFSNQ